MAKPRFYSKLVSNLPWQRQVAQGAPISHEDENGVKSLANSALISTLKNLFLHHFTKTVFRQYHA